MRWGWVGWPAPLCTYLGQTPGTLASGPFATSAGRQQVNGEVGRAGQVPYARVRGVSLATQTSRMLASPRKVIFEKNSKRGQLGILLALLVRTVILSALLYKAAITSHAGAG